MKNLLLLIAFSFLIHTTSNSQVKTPADNSPKLAEPKTTLSKDTVKLNGDSAVLWNNVVVLFKKSKDTSKLEISPFSLSFGYNFDFLDGIKTNELYADLRVDLPNVFKKKTGTNRKDFLDRIGLEAGAYQLRTVSRLDTVLEQFRLVDSKLIPPDDFQLLYITANSKSVRKTIRENLDIYLQPKFEVIGTEETKLNVLIHGEWLRSILNHSFERSLNNIDTTLFVPEDWPIPYNTVNEVPNTEKSKDYEYNFYIGTGLDLRVTKKEASFYLKMICGYNKAKLVRDLDGMSVLSNTDGWYYLAKFEVLETKVTGIKLGVEVRGLFPREKPFPTIDRAVPGFGIYLAKQFTFQKVGELFKP